MKENLRIVQTAEEFAADMERLAELIPTDRESLEACAALIEDGVQHNFDNAQTAGGAKWPPHAPATIRRHGPHPLLILSGAMRAAATNSGPGHIENNDGETLTKGVSGTDIPYAGYQQDGTTKIPQREFMAISEETADACAEEFAEHGLQRAAGWI